MFTPVPSKTGFKVHASRAPGFATFGRNFFGTSSFDVGFVYNAPSITNRRDEC
jgi:hypothetical protein